MLKVQKKLKKEPTEEKGWSIPKSWGFYNSQLDILPVEKIPILKSNAVVQTKPIWTKEKGTHTAVVSIETQTEELIKLDEIKEYPPSLIEFFQKVTPMLCIELENNSKFDQICIFKELNASKLPEINIKMDVRKIFSFKNMSATKNELKVATMSLSHSGIHMAIGYGASSHGENDNWCHHTTILSLYNLNKLETSLPYPKPEKELLELDYCISILEFNPQNGYILAVGNVTGGIGLIDFMSTDSYSRRWSWDKKTKSIWKGVCHSDQIVAIKWITLTQSQIEQNRWQNPQLSSQFLITASKDGFIGLWSIGRISLSIYLEKRYALLVENINESIPLKNDAYQKIRELGITSLTCSNSDPTKIIFSTFGSFIFCGDILSTRQINKYEAKTSTLEYNCGSEIPLYDPDSLFVMSQLGIIVALHCSPFHQSYVLSLTMEGHIILQNVLYRAEPSLEFYMDINTLSVDIKWSPHRPMMFAVANSKNLYIYDLLQDKCKPSLVIKHEQQLRSIEFNKGRFGEITIIDVEGEVFSWELPFNMSHRQPKELAQLIDLERELQPE